MTDSPFQSRAGIRSTLAHVPAIGRILPAYVAGLARDVGLLGDHLAAGRRDELRRVAHQLRGSGGGYGFDGVSRLAEAVESDASAGRPLGGVVDDVVALIDEIRCVEGYDPAGEARPPLPAAA